MLRASTLHSEMGPTDGSETSAANQKPGQNNISEEQKGHVNYFFR